MSKLIGSQKATVASRKLLMNRKPKSKKLVIRRHYNLNTRHCRVVAEMRRAGWSSAPSGGPGLYVRSKAATSNDPIKWTRNWEDSKS